MSIDEPVIVSEYDPAWPTLFAAERNRVRNACGLEVTRIDHFGSTAVPGMAAKPIVDLLVGVRNLEAFAPHVARLEAIGYRNFGPIFIPQRWYLRRRGPPHFNLAVTLDGGEFWTTQIRVREFLRSHPEEAAQYSRLKREIFEAGSRTFSSYSQAKAGFVNRLLERSKEENSVRGWSG